MVKKFSQIQRLSLLLLTLEMLLLAACAPAISEPVATSSSTPLVNTQVSSQVPREIATGNMEIVTDQPTPAMVATSRGPNLQATDPSTVNLASGQLHLVEFFRFT